MYSFSQNFEDVYIRRAFGEVDQGFYIDAGAYDPVVDSVTKMLYDLGWSGINLEPGPSFNAFTSRTRDVTLPYALGGRDGSATYFYNAQDPGTSSLAVGRPGDDAASVRSYDVPVVSVATLYDKHVGPRHVHFLKLDVEGGEWPILSSTDWNRHRPELIIAESTLPYTNTRRDEGWAQHLEKFGYSEVFFDGVNTYYLRAESLFRQDAFSRPVNVLDRVHKFEPVQHGALLLEIVAAEERGRSEVGRSLAALRERAASVALRCDIDPCASEGTGFTADADAVSRVLGALDAGFADRAARLAEAERQSGAVSELHAANLNLEASNRDLRKRFAASRIARFQSIAVATAIDRAILRAREAAWEREREQQLTEIAAARNKFEMLYRLALSEILRVRLEQQADRDEADRRQGAAVAKIEQTTAQVEQARAREASAAAALSRELEPLPVGHEPQGRNDRPGLLLRIQGVLFGRAAIKRADQMRALGRQDVAEEAYRQAYRLRPDRHDLLVQRGNMLKDAGRYREAEIAYEVALMRAPEDPDISERLAELFHKAGRPLRAERALAQAHRLREGERADRGSALPQTESGN